MSFKTAIAVASSAVATSGTFTVAYPDGHTAGSFASYGHQMYVDGHQFLYTQDAGKMSASFGASNITVTYLGTTTIQISSRIVCQFNKIGQDDREQALSPLDTMNRMVPEPLARLRLGAPKTADSDGICESQTVTFATTPLAVLDGAQSDLYNAAKVYLDVPRNVVGSWTSTAVVTITGKDEYGNTMVEKSASGTSLTGKKAFKRVDSVSFSANVSAATIGFGDVIGLPVFVEKIAQIRVELQDGVVLSANENRKHIDIDIADLSAEASYYIPIPFAGTLKQITSAIDGAVSTADATITALKVGGSAMTSGVVTIATASSAAGDYDNASPTDNNTFVAGDVLKLTVTGGGAGGSPKVHVVAEFDVTKDSNGTFVAGVQTAATATTGDVRGTYDPFAACDGAKYFALIVECPDPHYLGVNQYAG